MAAKARMTIALPVELKDRMTAVQKSNVVTPNWSAVARSGLEAALIGFERIDCDLTDAIARIRASKQAAEQFDLVEGTADGREWVRTQADYRTLKRLASGVSRFSNAFEHPLAWIRWAIDPCGSVTDPEICAILFDNACSDRIEYDTYLRAFIEGALEAWEEIAPHIEAEPADYRFEIVEPPPPETPRVNRVHQMWQAVVGWLARTFPADATS